MKKTLTIVTALAVLGVVVLVVGLWGSISMENSNRFCASCHTEPESAYYDRTQQAAIADLATLHTSKGVRCIDCHSGQGFMARIAGVVNYGMRDTLAFYSGRYHSPAITTRPLDNVSCTKCHDPAALVTQGMGEEGSRGHYHETSLQALWRQSGGPVNRCAACHPAHPQVGSAATLFTSLEIAGRGCQDCHRVMGVEGS